MKPERVLFVCHGHPELVPGGTEMVAHDLFRTIRDEGHAETMFLGCVSRLHRPARPWAGFQTIGRSRDELLFWVGGFDRFMLGHTETAGFVQALTELLASFRPDVVHFHHFALIGLEALAVTRRVVPGARIIATLHDYHPICANDGLMVTTEGALCEKASPDACRSCFPDIAQNRFAARALHLRNMFELVDRFVAPSRFLKDRFVEWGIAADRIEIIANAVPDIPQPRVSPPLRAPRIFGLFANVAPHKGVVQAIDAAARLSSDVPAIELRVHGGLNFQSDAFRARFDTALAEAAGVVSHRGAYRRAQLPQLMTEIDCVVVPSTWWENAPLVILEAFRHRRPVICSDIGGMAELVGDGINGLHFRAGDTLALANAMRRVIAEDGLYRKLVAGTPDVPRLTKAAANHIKLYSDLLARKEARTA